MPALFLNILKLLFLALLYLFLWQVARAVRTHVGTGASARGGGSAGEVVVLRSESSGGQRVRLRPSGHVVGRSDEADIVIEDPYASEFHARLGLQDGAVMLHDLGSTNGTYVNGRRVTAPTSLSKGDSVQIGKTIIEVR